MNIKFDTVVNKIYLINYSRYHCYFIKGFILMKYNNILQYFLKLFRDGSKFSFSFTCCSWIFAFQWTNFCLISIFSYIEIFYCLPGNTNIQPPTSEQQASKKDKLIMNSLFDINQSMKEKKHYLIDVSKWNQ